MRNQDGEDNGPRHPPDKHALELFIVQTIARAADYVRTLGIILFRPRSLVSILCSPNLKPIAPRTFLLVSTIPFAPVYLAGDIEAFVETLKNFDWGNLLLAIGPLYALPLAGGYAVSRLLPWRTFRLRRREFRCLVWYLVGTEYILVVTFVVLTFVGLDTGLIPFLESPWGTRPWYRSLAHWCGGLIWGGFVLWAATLPFRATWGWLSRFGSTGWLGRVALSFGVSVLAAGLVPLSLYARYLMPTAGSPKQEAKSAPVVAKSYDVRATVVQQGGKSPRITLRTTQDSDGKPQADIELIVAVSNVGTEPIFFERQAGLLGFEDPVGGAAPHTVYAWYPWSPVEFREWSDGSAPILVLNPGTTKWTTLAFKMYQENYDGVIAKARSGRVSFGLKFPGRDAEGNSHEVEGHFLLDYSLVSCPLFRNALRGAPQSHGDREEEEEEEDDRPSP